MVRRLCDIPSLLTLTLGALALDLMDADNGFLISAVDIGYPNVREDTSAIPARDGQWDNTARFGARVVSITGTMIPAPLGSRSMVLDTLAPFLVPSARPVLTYQIDADMPPRQLTLRASALSAPANDPTASAFQAAWVASDPVAYSTVTQTVDLVPQGLVFGRTYATPQGATVTPTSGFTHPRTYPAMSGGQAVTVTNGGALPAWPLIQIFGDCTNPQVINDTVPGTLAVGTTARPLQVRAGEVLTIDTRNRLVYLGADPANSRYDFVDFAASSWWPLVPGPNHLRFNPSAATTAAYATVQWADAYL